MKVDSLSLSLSLYTPDSRLQSPSLLVRAQTPSTFPSPQKGKEGTLEALSVQRNIKVWCGRYYVISFFTKLL
jgi:hypothetical protein